jgi:hypothetical protein
MRFHPAFDCTLATRLSLAILWGMMSMILSHWCSSHRGSTITKKKIFAISSKNHYEFQKKAFCPMQSDLQYSLSLDDAQQDDDDRDDKQNIDETAHRRRRYDSQ